MDIRSIWLAIGVVLHIVVWATMDVGPFSAVCIASYACFFHADELKRMGRWLASRRSAPPPSPRESTPLQTE
jgi:hypothetical protein